jgi:surface antigen
VPSPTRSFQDGKAHCREFLTELSAGKGGRNDKVTGVACRGAKGEWLLKS